MKNKSKDFAALLLVAVIFIVAACLLPRAMEVERELSRSVVERSLSGDIQ